MATKQVAGQLAELHVFSELLKQGVMPYAPAVETGSDYLLKTAKGAILELAVKVSGKGNGTFVVPDYQPDKKRFIVCVEFDESDAPVAWVLPSLVFHAYSTRPSKKDLRTLNLDGGRRKYFGEPLRDYIRGFRNRWELIADYQYYRRFMNSPERFEDLEDILLMLLVAERPDTDEESVLFRASAFGVTDALSG
jgi:hypothetical protein